MVDDTGAPHRLVHLAVSGSGRRQTPLRRFPSRALVRPVMIESADAVVRNPVDHHQGWHRVLPDLARGPLYFAAVPVPAGDSGQSAGPG